MPGGSGASMGKVGGGRGGTALVYLDQTIEHKIYHKKFPLSLQYTLHASPLCSLFLSSSIPHARSVSLSLYFSRCLSIRPSLSGINMYLCFHVNISNGSNLALVNGSNRSDKYSFSFLILYFFWQSHFLFVLSLPASVSTSPLLPPPSLSALSPPLFNLCRAR
jgi:hypothetical protein